MFLVLLCRRVCIAHSKWLFIFRTLNIVYFNILHSIIDSTVIQSNSKALAKESCQISNQQYIIVSRSLPEFSELDTKGLASVQQELSNCTDYKCHLANTIKQTSLWSFQIQRSHLCEMRQCFWALCEEEVYSIRENLTELSAINE